MPPSDFGVLENVQIIHAANYAVQAKVTKQYNITTLQLLWKVKLFILSYNTGIYYSKISYSSDYRVLS